MQELSTTTLRAGGEHACGSLDELLAGGAGRASRDFTVRSPGTSHEVPGDLTRGPQGPHKSGTLFLLQTIALLPRAHRTHAKSGFRRLVEGTPPIDSIPCARALFIAHPCRRLMAAAWLGSSQPPGCPASPRRPSGVHEPKRLVAGRTIWLGALRPQAGACRCSGTCSPRPWPMRADRDRVCPRSPGGLAPQKAQRVLV